MLTLLPITMAFAKEPLPAPLEGTEALHVLGDAREMPEGAAVWTAGALVNLRAEPTADAPVTLRLAAATRVVVLEDMGAWVEVRVGATRGWVARELVSTMGRVTDLDGDGVEERIVVGRAADGATHAWLREGDAQVQQVLVYPAPDPYLGSWALVPASEAGTTLLRVTLDQDSCGAYPSVWLSYAGDTLRTALEVLPWTDGASGEKYDVRFVEPGLVSVRQEQYGEIEPVVTERACLLTAEGVFRCS